MTLLRQNLLAKERSPYLLQHANNPVKWYPWGEEALQKAKVEKKPILLSIGYAACHWCHVMAHESFEDEETASLMNDLFINIKVDREERPDLDKIYQTAHYLLTRSGGGWPLTIFLTPDTLSPFFSGTYFPRESRYQLPAFKEILRVIADIYVKKQDLIKQQNRELKQILSSISLSKSSSIQLSLVPLQFANESLEQLFDSTYGGFGSAPKFPQTKKLEFLFPYDSPIVFTTLKYMAEGGIYDQLRGGFYRYSVDEAWLIPHFEKMLYDNGQLLFVYAIASKLYTEPLFKEVTRQTADWILQEMQSPQGGFFSSIDADSEGKEGKYYLWDKQEIEKLLNQEEYKVSSLFFGLDQLPSIENQWHLSVAKSLHLVVDELKISEDDAVKLLATAKEKLRKARDKRVRPYRDEKILCSWNSLTIKGLLAAGEVLHEPKYIAAGKKSLEFIYANMWSHKRLFACYKDNEAYNDAYLDDYALLLDALLYVLQIEWNNDFFLWAKDIAQVLFNHFYDNTHGGFFFTADDHEALLYRPKIWIDEAQPSGNGVAIQGFLTLGHLLSNMEYLNVAEKTLQAAWPSLTTYPQEHTSLLIALNELLNPSTFIVIRGPADKIKKWHDWCRNENPFYKVFAIPSQLDDLAELKKYKSAKETIAYVCQGTQCNEVQDFDEFKKIISA